MRETAPQSPSDDAASAAAVATPENESAAETSTEMPEAVHPRRVTLRRVLIGGSVAVTTAGAVVAAHALHISPHDILAPVTHFVSTHGVMGVAGGVGMESMGVPVPGEATLVTVSALAGHAHDLPKLPLIIGAAAAGGIVGDNIGYGIGRFAGDKLVKRFGHKPKTQTKLKVGRYLFRRYGGPVVFCGRFVALLRTTAAFLAGANEMPWPKFMAYNAAGAIGWASVYGTAGYFLGNSLHSKPVTYSLIGVAVTSMVVGGAVMKRKMKHIEAAAEEMFPGPLALHDDRGSKRDGAAKQRGAGEPPSAPTAPAEPRRGASTIE